MKIFTRKKKIRDETLTEIDVVRTWEVRWESRHGEWQGNTEPEVEVFTSEEDAQTFKRALEDAFTLIRHTSGDKVVIKERI